MKTYIEFLKYCLDERLALPAGVENINWKEMMAWASEQAILGVVYAGITDKRNKREDGKSVIQMPFDVLMEWVGTAQQIEMQNKVLNKRCVEVVEEYRKAGYGCCVLKGQGNAMMYPNPFLRNPGDIDLWVLGHTDDTDGTDGRPTVGEGHTEITEITDGRPMVGDKDEDGRGLRRKLIEMARKKDKNAEVRVYHVGYQEKDVEVEAHFMPGVMNNPVYNRRLQAFYREHTDSIESRELPDGVGCIPVPTWEFNVVFQLAHMMHHFFDEGIGLRQFIDYYYLLKRATDYTDYTDGRPLAGEGHTETTEITERWPLAEEGHTDSTDRTDFRPVAERDGKERLTLAEVGGVLRRLNLDRFAGAVMYVLKEVLGLEERYLIVPVDERRGKTLMEEVMKGGNFGRASGMTNHSMGMKYLLKTKRNLRLAQEYPAEALCEPFFRTWHFFWRVFR